MPISLIALALGGFGIGLTEFVIMGLLPEVAADFAVTPAVVGWLISGYALSVVVGALGLTAAVNRFSRKRVLVALMVLFIVGNLLSAIAPTYGIMLSGRIIAALCHGAFFGIGAVVAASLVPENKKAGAIAIMFTGLTAANVLGVPFGTLFGQAFGWRSTFWAITAIGVVALLGLVFLLPAIAPPRAGTASLRQELRAFRSPQVWLSIAVTVLGFGGMFGAFTYIAFTLTEVAGFAASMVPWLLVVFGVGLFAGNVLGGKLADRNLDASLLAFLGALTLVLVFFALTAANPIATVVSLILMGGFGFGVVPGLQMRVMRYANGATTLASGANIAAFNLGNALGAGAGGSLIASGLGYTAPIWAGAAAALVAFLVMALAAAGARRRAAASALPTDRGQHEESRSEVAARA